MKKDVKLRAGWRENNIREEVRIGFESGLSESCIIYFCNDDVCLTIISVSVLKVWELSDLDRDGMLDRDEFSVVRNDTSQKETA